jgi:hypothetical protein
MSRKQAQERPIKISEDSIKGVCSNLRRFTEDMIASEDNSLVGCYSSSVSMDKLSPDSSFEKKYRHYISNQCEENISN